MTHVPVFDGHASPFANYEAKVALWNQISSMGPHKRAANFLLRMTVVARKVCMEQISRILRQHFAPDATDDIFQDMVKFTNFKRTGQNMDRNLTELDMLRQKAEARMLMGSGSPDEFASVLRVQNTDSAKYEKFLV